MTPAMRLATISQEPDFLAQVCERVANGETLRSLCSTWDVPLAKLRAWLAADADRLVAYEAAAEAARVLLDEDWQAGLAAMIRADIRQVLDADGRPRPVQDLGDIEALALAGIEVDERVEGRGEDRQVFVVRKIKFADRTKALELWGRHRQKFTDKVDLGLGESVAETLDRLRRPVGPRET